VPLPSHSLLAVAEQYHLAPIVFLFCFYGIISAVVMAIRAGFHSWSEIVEAYYECRKRCDEVKRRYEENKLVAEGRR
jgi:hypothetical protein